jgi:predicted SpoU family rRNA methylase
MSYDEHRSSSDLRRNTHVCERCRALGHHKQLFHCKSVDEYLCEDCIFSLDKHHEEVTS